MSNLFRPPKPHCLSLCLQTPAARWSWWQKVLCCLLTLLVLNAPASNAQSPCPDGKCNSGDLTVTKVELVDATTLGPLPNSCPPGGQSVMVKLKVTFDVTSNTRYGFVIIGDVYLNAVKGDKIWQCYPKEYTQGVHVEIVDQAFAWPCGSTIELRDVFTAWDNAAPATTICSYLNATNGTLTNCTNIDPKCKYYGATESFTVAAPLIADFTYSGSCPGNTLYQPLSFSSPASGAGAISGGNKPYQYSWQIKDAVTSVVLATGTGSSYTYTPVSAHNLSVTLTVTDGSTPQVSDEETKTVQVTSCCTPPNVTGQPTDQTKCAGAPASYSIAYSGGQPDPVIHWQVSTDGSTWTILTNAAPYSNTSTTTLSISSVTASMNQYRYRAVLQSGVCTAVESDAATLNVNPATVGGGVSPAQTVCSGSAPASGLTVSGHTGTVVRWQRSTDGFASNSTNISNTSTTLSAAAIGALTGDTWFRAVIKSGVCDEVYSAAVKISVDPVSAGGSVSAPQRICTGSQPVDNLELSGHTGAVVKWQRSSSANFSAEVTDINATTAILPASTIGTLTTDTWFRAVVKSGVCGEAYSAAVKITVDPTTVGGSTGAGQTICSGSQPANSLQLSGQVGTVVKWQWSSDNFNLSASDIAHTSATLGTDKIGVLTQDTWFRAVVKSGECLSVSSGAVKITVQQPLSNNTIAADQTICSATTPAALTGSAPSGGNETHTYQWQWRTTGTFANIPNANDKDYTPGALNQTTQFRRIVTSGSACPSHTSNTVTITISQESVVYPLEGSNYCATAPNTGTITLGGSYPGVHYQLTRTSDNSPVGDPKLGTGAILTWTGLDAGTYYVKGTGIAPTYCTSQTANATVHMFDCSVFYTLTQGYYGGKNGKSCIGSTPVKTIQYLLGDKDLWVGTTKWIKVPATYAGATKLNSVLPGGGTPSGLPNPSACDITTGCFKAPAYLTKQDRINNVLLSQTLTLSLNARWQEGELLLFPIRSGYLTTQQMTGCQEGAVVVDVCSGNTVSSIRMNEKVVQYLGEGATVANLLELANKALGGTVAAGVGNVPSYSDINEAVSCINESFDEGRRFLDYYAEKQTCELLFPAPLIAVPPVASSNRAAVEKEAIGTPTALKVSAYPNPFADRVRFDVESPLSGNGSLELYNVLGQKVTTVYQGFISEGRQSFEAHLSGRQPANLIYVLQVGGQRVTGKLFHRASQ